MTHIPLLKSVLLSVTFFFATAVYAQVYVTNSHPAVTVASSSASGGGTIATSPDFHLAGGNAVVLFFTAEGPSAPNYNAQFDGQPMSVIRANQGAQYAGIFYLINPTNSVGKVTITGPMDAGQAYAYSILALANVAAPGATDSEVTTTSTQSTPIALTYATTVNGALVAGAAANNGTSSRPPPTLSTGNPDIALLSPALLGSSGHYHVYGDVASPGTYTDIYTNPYQRSAYVTAVFEAFPDQYPAPSGLTLQGLAFGTNPTVSIGWAAAPGAFSYKIFRRRTDETFAIEIGTTSGTTFADSDVTLFDTYFYSLVAVTPNGKSARTPELSVTIISGAGIPNPPAGLNADGANRTSVPLAWQPVPDAITYDIYRSEFPDKGFGFLTTTSNASYVDMNGIEGAKSYYYKLAVTTSGGISAQSDVFEVGPRFDANGVIPEAPLNLTTESRTTYTTSLRWAAVDHADGYHVWRSTRPNDGFHRIALTESPTLEDTFSVMPQNEYYYKVQAIGSGGVSAYSTVLKTDALLQNTYRMETLRRAPVAVPSNGGVLVTWRLLGTDPDTLSFNVYRDGRRINTLPLTGATNFHDALGQISAQYEVRPVFNDKEISMGEAARPLHNTYWSVPLDRPAGGTTPDAVIYEYDANDASVADLDGDGEYEIILKWDPTNSKDNANNGYTGNVYIDAYKMNGTRLWRIDLGRNIRAGAHYTQFMVYDFDGDGKAELICKTADGTTDGLGTVIGNATADFRNAQGRVLSGSEFLTCFDGQTGAIVDTIPYLPARGNVASWGDTNGNRVDRFTAGVAYLDGMHPTFYAQRGYYTRTVVATFDLVSGKLVQRWVFDSDVVGSQYGGQGNHQTSVGDVDGDGKDEIMLGSLTIDNDGTLLWSNNLGHGDAMHYGDLDPTRPGMELYTVKESTTKPYHHVYSDAATGTLIWGVRTGVDTGRGVAADIDPRYAGSEVWGAANTSMWNSAGEVIGERPSSQNFVIQWDGDPLNELMSGTSVRKVNYFTSGQTVIMDGLGTASNNDTKSTPCLQADLLGDWREEVVLRATDSSELRIYSTPYPTALRIHTLMHDPTYRVAIAWQNSGYNQPPHPSFFIGHNMPAVAKPRIFSDPVAGLSGLKNAGGDFTSDVLVALIANLDPSLANEYRVNGGVWSPYAAPFSLASNGHHTVEFRTKDRQGLVIAESITTTTITKQVPGDIDGDLNVDTDDRAILLAALRKKVGQSGYVASADLDNNGSIDNSDYALWRAYYAAFQANQ